ncbi:MAG: T9SS type A sorting domain-containing protein [Bacteroidia bacterium]|nr:T9SS type A sorting domain-containing protein [Bacteroidia bacterium]
MKKIYYLLFVCIQANAQISFNTTPKYLDVNRVKARINNVNNKFWNIASTGNASYEVPKGSGAHAQFANSIWIGGFDAGGQLHVSANTYRQLGTDFWAGPLDTTNIGAYSFSNSTVYNKLWKVSCKDINDFMTAYSNGWISAGTYTTPPDIVNYPAYGISNFQKKLEPYFDVNGNGVYNPVAEGDYPIIKGHQQILSIYNDQQGNHGETQAPAMGLEIHERSYAYYDATLPDSMKAVNHTTFYHYTIYNRSNTSYFNTYIGDWSDVDLGYYLDDYIGTDTINSFAYCYNADAIDETAQGTTGYGNKPPVVSHAIIKTPCTNDGVDNNHNGTTDEVGEEFLMDRTTYYNNNIGAFLPQTTNPQIALHYYNYMAGKWKDASPFTYGGDAYGGVKPTNYVYTGNPVTNSGWTESSAGNLAGDRRIIFSSGPFTFPANSKIEWAYAVVFSQDTAQSVNTITQFNSRVQRDVRNVRYYDQQHQMPLCTPALTITTGAKEFKGSVLNGVVYPNPAQHKISIELTEKVNHAVIKLSDVSGRLLKEISANDFSKTTLDVSDLPGGVYFVEVKSGNYVLTQKVIKNN